MEQITFTIPDNKLQKIIDSMKGLYSIPQVNKGTAEKPDMQPEFTDNQWAKECVRRFIKRTDARYRQKVAKDAITYAEDNDLAT